MISTVSWKKSVAYTVVATIAVVFAAPAPMTPSRVIFPSKSVSNVGNMFPKNSFSPVTRTSHLSLSQGNKEHKMESKSRYNGPLPFASPPLSSVIEAIKIDDIDVLEEILERDEDLTARIDVNQWTPLIWAAQTGAFDCAFELIKLGADVNYQVPSTGKTPLMFAIENEQYDLVVILLNHGASIHLMDNFGNTPFHLAIEAKNQELAIDFLSNKVLFNTRNSTGHTPFSTAISKGLDVVVRAMLDFGFDVNQVQGKGYSPLILAIIAQKPIIVDDLLLSGADKDYIVQQDVDHYLWTPLMFAAKGKNSPEILKIIEILVSSQVNLDAVEVTGNSALMIALLEGHQHAATRLIEAGSSLDLVSKTGLSALEIAENKGFMQ